MPAKYTEAQAIAALRRVAARWTHTLTIASMDGCLLVLPTGGYLDAGGSVDESTIIADVPGIPNTGGGM